MNDMTPGTMTASSTTPSKVQPTQSPGAWLRHEIGRLFDEVEGPARSAFNFGLRGLTPSPALDMVEEDGAYRLSVELPGIDEKDVEISVADGVLCVSGETKQDHKRDEDGFMISERRYGKFMRKVPLPTDADQENIKAKFKRGILKIEIGKDTDASSRMRKIEIEAD
jgi:HSP20 family protein